MKNISLILIMLFANYAFTQQMGHTESYPLNKLGYNPAIASIDKKAHLTAIGQYGDNNSLGSLKNYYLAAEISILKTAGLAIQYSDYSDLLLKNKTFSFGLSKHFKINDKATLSFGLSTGFVNSKIDYNTDYGLSVIKEEEKTSAAFKPTSSNNQAKMEIGESQYLLGGGIFLNAEKWHLGFSIPNLIKNELPADLTQSTKIVLERPAFLSIEKDFKFSEKLKLTSGGLYRFSKNEFQKGLDIQSSIWLKEKYSLGLWYQRIGAKSIGNNKPLLATTEIIVNKVRLSYSFNLTNNAANYTNIKQQIMLRLDIDYLKEKQKN